MRHPLQEKTNNPEIQEFKEKKITKQKSEKEQVIKYLKEVTTNTKDYSLKYDLSKCIEIIEGKENQDVLDLKQALEEALIENEILFQEKSELLVENDYLRTQKEGKHAKM